jgi:nucleoside-diphosphate-sugar epimerase
MRVVVTGGAGFLGSHLCEWLIAGGDRVVAVDNFSSGRKGNLLRVLDSPNFELIDHDICSPIPVPGQIDLVLNFASPASPPRYAARSIETLRTGSLGTDNAIQLGLKFTVTHSSTHRKKATGATLTRTARDQCTTRRSGTPKR